MDLSETNRQAPDALAPGTRIDNRYRVRKLLGMGGMGAVYLVADEQTGDDLALKILRPDRLSQKTLTRLAGGEARTGWHLNRRGVLHPHIVRTLHIGRWRAPGAATDVPYLVMEYIEGQTLKEWMESVGPDELPDPEQALTFVRQIGKGMAAAHEAGVLHRDLKPENVLIEAASGLAKVTDFGIARPLAGGSGLTNHLRHFATVRWAAPEQLDPTPRQPEGPATDVYSLGKLLYHLLSGRFYDPTFYRPLGGTHHLPYAVDRLIQRACRANPEDRFSDMTAFLAALDPVHDAYRSLREAEEEDPEFRGNQERIQELKGQYQFCLDRDLPWSDRLPILEELTALGAADAKVGEWLEARDEHLRQGLTERLEVALEAGERAVFQKELSAGANLLAAGESRNWQNRFARRHAEMLAGEERFAEAGHLLRPLVIDQEMPQGTREAMLVDLLRIEKAANQHQERARLCARLAARYDDDGDELTLEQRWEVLELLRHLDPEAPELQDRLADYRAAVVAAYDQLDARPAVEQRRRLYELLAKVAPDADVLAGWRAEIERRKEAQRITEQLEGSKVDGTTVRTYEERLTALQQLCSPDDPDVLHHRKCLDAYRSGLANGTEEGAKGVVDRPSSRIRTRREKLRDRRTRLVLLVAGGIALVVFLVFNINYCPRDEPELTATPQISPDKVLAAKKSQIFADLRKGAIAAIVLRDAVNEKALRDAAAGIYLRLELGRVEPDAPLYCVLLQAVLSHYSALRIDGHCHSRTTRVLDNATRGNCCGNFELRERTLDAPERANCLLARHFALAPSRCNGSSPFMPEVAWSFDQVISVLKLLRGSSEPLSRGRYDLASDPSRAATIANYELSPAEVDLVFVLVERRVASMLSTDQMADTTMAALDAIEVYLEALSNYNCTEPVPPEKHLISSLQNVLDGRNARIREIEKALVDSERQWGETENQLQSAIRNKMEKMTFLEREVASGRERRINIQSEMEAVIARKDEQIEQLTNELRERNGRGEFKSLKRELEQCEEKNRERMLYIHEFEKRSKQADKQIEKLTNELRKRRGETKWFKRELEQLEKEKRELMLYIRELEKRSKQTTKDN